MSAPNGKNRWVGFVLPSLCQPEGSYGLWELMVWDWGAVGTLLVTLRTLVGQVRCTNPDAELPQNTSTELQIVWASQA